MYILMNTYSHPQIDGKVNHHQISRDLLFHLFGDDYIYIYILYIMDIKIIEDVFSILYINTHTHKFVCFSFILFIFVVLLSFSSHSHYDGTDVCSSCRLMQHMLLHFAATSHAKWAKFDLSGVSWSGVPSSGESGGVFWMSNLKIWKITFFYG